MIEPSVPKARPLAGPWRVLVVLIFVWLSAVSTFSLWEQMHDHQPTFGDATSHLHELPGTSCVSTNGDTESCTWGRWSLTLFRGQVGTERESCHGQKEHHVWSGFGDWRLTMAPLAGGPRPALTSDEYGAIQQTFDFGSGGAWQLC